MIQKEKYLQNLFSERTKTVFLGRLNQNEVPKLPVKFAFHCHLIKVFFSFWTIPVNAENPNSQNHNNAKG